ncbi:NAD(P)H-dependent oxidoreductase [Streptococcus ferus]|uniref:FMN-dependent NADH-azoreductase n=1 Tax=Streptococcus ferus TaxID=1345 RepID=UPI00351314AF
MHKTLIINAHPDFKNRSHHSTKMEDYFLKQVQEKYPDSSITILNLYGEMIPQIDEQTYAIYRKNAVCIDLTSAEKAVFERSTALLKQFKEHHRIVISSPLHNFNITARLKDYLDNIMIAREVYRYTETGSVGLMTDDYKVLYLQSSGSVYTNDDRDTPLEFSHLYLREMFENIMGFNQYYIARSQGTDLLGADQDAILAEARAEIDALLPVFYSS